MTRRETRHLFKLLLCIGAFAVLFGYAAFRAKDLVLGPRLEIASPSSGAVIDESLVEIQGEAKNISFLTLNGNKIFTDEEGFFKEKLLLSYGYNVITVAAKDRFGRVNTKTIQLVYK